MSSKTILLNKIKASLDQIYPDSDIYKEIKELVSEFRTFTKDETILKEFKVTSKDISLISYANTIESKDGKYPLEILEKFISKFELDKYLNTVHILPFYPWDTDRGFSVKDYYNVHPSYGDWDIVETLGKKVNLMFDFVANHASIENPIIQKALIERHLPKSDPRYKEYSKYKDFVIAYSEEKKPKSGKLKKLARPRPNPVLTKYIVYKTFKDTIAAKLGSLKTCDKDIVKGYLGEGWVWTTFSREKRPDGSEDTRQVDLNFANPKVFLETVKILLFYISKGARLIRLDAIGYIWKKLGSSSLHEPETHKILSIIYNIMKLAAPGVLIIAEVNEPQDKVLTYLGKKDNLESDMVYQFTHFPLAVHGVLTENPNYYSDWINSIEPFKGRQFITVLGSHDGMGLKPIRGILPEDEMERLIKLLVNHHKAIPNYATLPGGNTLEFDK